MRRLATLAPALVLAAATAACKGDPPAKPAEPAATAHGTAPTAPIHVPRIDPSQDDPSSAPPPADDSATRTPPPRPSLAVPMAQDPATLRKQVAKMDEVIARTQAAYDQATDEPSRHKAGTLLEAMRKRRNDVATRVGIPPIASGSGSGSGATAPAPDPNAPAP